MGRGEGVLSYIFISHASADNARLKPVVAALLDAGIPLWFDRPEDLGLPRELFAGCLAFGESWRETILDVIGQGAGMLVFPSPTAAKAREVYREVGAAQLLSKKTPRHFQLLSALLSPDDGLYEGDVTGGLHSLSVFTRAAEGHADGEASDIRGPYVLTPRGETNLEILISLLRGRLEAKAELEPAPTPPGSTDGDFVLPYRADRLAQRDRAALAFADLRRPPVFVVHGPERQAPNRFTSVSLGQQVLTAHGLFACAGATRAPVSLRWPGIDADETDRFQLSFARSAIERFQGGASTPTLAEWNSVEALLARLAASLRRDAITRIFSARLPLAEMSPSRAPDAISAWCALWARFPFDQAQTHDRFPVVPVLELIHPEPPRGLARVLAPNWSRLLDTPGFAAKLTRRFTSVTPVVLPALPDISAQCARDWVVTDEIFGAQGDDERERLTDALVSLFPARQGAGLSMREWALRSRPHLATVSPS